MNIKVNILELSFSTGAQFIIVSLFIILNCRYRIQLNYFQDLIENEFAFLRNTFESSGIKLAFDFMRKNVGPCWEPVQNFGEDPERHAGRRRGLLGLVDLN